MTERANQHVMYRNAKHGISKWTIYSIGSTIHMESESKIGDTPTRYTEEVAKGKAGRTLAMQVKSRVDSRVNSKRDHGYVFNYEDAKKPLTNILGLHKPMLAVKYRDVVRTTKLERCFVQPKLDGHRCMMTRDDNGKVVAYSRAGRYIDTMKHITAKFDIPEGITLDGELYKHGIPLQVISSWAKRVQPESIILDYVVYDIVDTHSDYEDRHEMLKEIVQRNSHIVNLKLCPTRYIGDIEDYNLTQDLKAHIGQKYEGLMLRPDHWNYEIGRRSKGLIKVKALEDDEAKVFDITTSKDGWAVLHCRHENGKEFKLSAPGTIVDKTRVLENKDKFIGKTVTYEYAQLTQDGKPFHAVALRWREDL